MRIRATDLRLLVAMLATVASAWTFGWVASEVGEGDTQPIDEAVVWALREPHRPDAIAGSTTLGQLARDVTALGSVPVLVLVTVAVAGFLALSHLYRSLLLVLSAAIGGTVWTFLLKELFARERPRVYAEAVVSTASFPSGHSALSAVIYLTLAALLARLVERRRLRVYVVSVAALTTFLVGVSRVALGVHYPSDVLAGWTLGLAWALFCWVCMALLQRRGQVETVAEAHDAAHAGT